jgi:hypothetical protein
MPVNGIEYDGAIYPLEGQPPRAQKGSWGNTGWLYARQNPILRRLRERLRKMGIYF